MKKLTPAEKKRIVLWIVLIVVGLVVYFGVYRSHAELPDVVLLKGPTATRTRTPTPSGLKNTPVPATATVVLTSTATVGPTNTALPPTATQIPGAAFTPWPAAPLCTEHSFLEFHTLWNATAGCHYDHEHGQNPFVPEVAAIFPGIQDFLGGVQVGHTNPSSPIENSVKHGGMKWNVQLVHPQNCAGFENAVTGVNASVIQYHGFGDYAIEAEARFHSTVAILRQCRAANPTDYGYVYINQLQDYGQRITPYQGTILPYPNQPQPPFLSPLGPYLSFDCLDLTAPHVAQCRPSFAYALTHAASSNWAAGIGGNGHSDAPDLFRLLWRVGDIYRLFDWNDQTYPFTFLWLCSTDGGASYNPVGCKYNNTTTQVNEIEGKIPTAWDNLGGWDTNPTVGRISVEGFVDSGGDPVGFCHPSVDCYPIKLVNAFPGTYGSVMIFTTGKGTNIQLPREGDLHFCGQAVCAASAPGAVPSGWIGSQN